VGVKAVWAAQNAGVSWLAEEMLAAKEGLCSMDFVNCRSGQYLA
jgi:hypothetical protein